MIGKKDFLTATFQWLPLAIVFTALTLLVYVVGQQGYRMAANDPQIQTADEVATKIAAGTEPSALVPLQAIDLATNSGIFITIADISGNVIASNAILDGTKRVPPTGTLLATKNDQNRTTWQPKKGVRLATVIQSVKNGNIFVIVGRSLTETERRIDNLGTMALAVWLVGLVLSIGMSIVTTAVVNRSKVV